MDKFEQLEQAAKALRGEYGASAQRREENRYRLQSSYGRTSNAREIEVIESLEDSGWEVHRNGWPDLLVYHDGRLRFVEIKPPGRGLSSRQQRVAQILTECTGIPVEIAHAAFRGWSAR